MKLVRAFKMLLEYCLTSTQHYEHLVQARAQTHAALDTDPTLHEELSLLSPSSIQSSHHCTVVRLYAVGHLI